MELPPIEFSPTNHSNTQRLHIFIFLLCAVLFSLSCVLIVMGEVTVRDFNLSQLLIIKLQIKQQHFLPEILFPVGVYCRSEVIYTCEKGIKLLISVIKIAQAVNKILYIACLIYRGL